MQRTKEQIDNEILEFLRNNEGQEFSINRIKEKIDEKNKILKWRLKKLVKQEKIESRNTEHGKVFYFKPKNFKTNKLYVKDGKLIIDKKQLKIRLVALLIIILVTFMSGEILVRIFDPQMLYNKHNPSYPTYPKEVEYDQELGWSTVKNYKAEPYSSQKRNPVVTITHNSKGFRMDHEVDENKDIILMTGDSLTYGFWVDDKKIVSAQLNEMLGSEYEVVNLAVGGYGTDQAFLRFIRDGLQYKPKAVVHVLFNNDFSNIFYQYQYDVFKPLFVIEENKLQLTNVPTPLSKNYELSYPKQREHKYHGFNRFMRSWSHLYVLYKYKMPQTKSAIKKLFRPPEKEDYFSSYKDGELWAIEREYTDKMKYAFNLNSLIIKNYAELAKQNNITFIFAVIGDRISVDPEVQKATVEQYYNIDDNFFDYEKPYRSLEEFAKMENIPIINLLPLFKEEFQQNKKNLYLEGDHHLGDYGHELFAKEIYKLLVQEGIVEDVKK